MTYMQDVTITHTPSNELKYVLPETAQSMALIERILDAEQKSDGYHDAIYIIENLLGAIEDNNAALLKTMEIIDDFQSEDKPDLEAAQDVIQSIYSHIDTAQTEIHAAFASAELKVDALPDAD